MSGKPKSPKSKLKAQIDKNNQAAKKVADQKARLALREQRNRVKEEGVRKLEIKQQKALAKEKELASKKRVRWTDDERFDLLAAFKECTEVYLDVNEKTVGFGVSKG
ncbi:hypothetical protein HDU77_004743, partial [Chytriomyces hyalinus]